MKRLSTIGLTFMLVSILLSGCKDKQEKKEIKASGYQLTQVQIFNTSANFKYEYGQSLHQEITLLLDSFDRSLNPFNPKSIIHQVNNNQPVELNDWFIYVFEKAQGISRLTGGMYDITAAPLINLWGFGYDKTKEASPAAIDSVRQFVGYDKIQLKDRQIVKTDPRIQLNASSLAKGFAVDLVAELFDSYRINNYMVEIGGEVRAKGINEKGETWRIGIAKPIDDNTGTINEYQEIISLTDKAMATSGNTRNYYIKEGKKYAHTINPLTGYPSENRLLSTTVIYPDCITADAFATAFMAMGLDNAMALADKIQDLEYVFIYLDENGRFATAVSSK